MLVIGLMSGTSADGVDVALIETDGERVAPRAGANGFAADTATRPYDAAERDLLREAMRDAVALTDRDARPGCLREAEALVTRAHAEAVEAALAAWGIAPGDVAAIGFHGQTVLHRPASGLTVQLGDGTALARRLGIPVVFDLRADDVAAGGEGAPLVPVFHRALAEASGLPLPLAVLNVGGVANVTAIGRDTLVGFDTGPGNALLDDLVKDRAGLAYDAEGRIAAAGTPNGALVAWLLAHPYFDRPAPKSLDRDAFSHRLVGQLGLEDAAATLAAFTAGAVARARAHLPEPPVRWIVGGGGARNPELMRRIGEALGGPVESADSVGWSADGLEAQAFAYLAARRLRDLPITFPGTTGVARPLPGGRIARP